jgi:type IV pilus assembly protein PilA
MKGLLKLLLRLSAPKKSAGFTLIELLIVVVILGILAAIAQPVFLNSVRKAREAHAKQYLGQINRAQQLHYFEFQQFGNLPDLGIPDEINDYQVSTSISATEVVTIAQPVSQNLHGFAGIVRIGTVNNSPVAQTELCKGTLGQAPARTDC